MLPPWGDTLSLPAGPVIQGRPPACWVQNNNNKPFLKFYQVLLSIKKYQYFLLWLYTSPWTVFHARVVSDF